MSSGERRAWTLPTLLGGVTALLHVLTAGDAYGLFRDELYYLANARHLGFGYVDHPPMVGWIAWVARALCGDSQVGLRVLPALAGGAAVGCTAWLAHELGGGRFAQALAGVSAAVAPIHVATFGYLSMNAFDALFWSAALIALARVLRTGVGRGWLAFGLVAGVGLENKISLLFLGVGVVAALLLTQDWKHFTARWLWLGGAVAALLFLPYVVWQVAHDWPTLEFMRNAARSKILPLSPGRFLAEQALQLGPGAAPFALAGLVFLFTRAGRPFRALGWAFVVILVLMLSLRSKAYYLSPAYPILFAAGGVATSHLTARRRSGWLRPVSLAVVALTGLAVAPLAKPLLPVEIFVRYQAALGVAPSSGERQRVGRLPQFFADRLGWRELAEAVAHVHRELPAPDRERACVFGQNYGQAAAIDFYGPALGLPRAISGHNSYHLWGPGDCTGELVIVIGDDRETLAELFGQVELARSYTCRDCMPYEAEKPIWLCRGLRLPIRELWPRVRNFI